MNVSIEYKGDMKFNASTTKSSFVIDCKEITPVEYIATSIIGCTGIDLVMMAKKDGFEVRNYNVNAEVIRQTTVPMKFSSVHIIYKFESDFDAVKAKRYIGASLESYCTTVNSIRDSVDISYTIIHNGITISENEKLISMNKIEEDDGFGGACCS